MNTEKTIYFQYVTNLNYPIFIGVSEADFNQEEVGIFLDGMNFSPVEVARVDKSRAESEGFRLLKVKLAQGRLLHQINSFYGTERLDDGYGFKIYRHKGGGLMIHSFGAKDWEVGVVKEFARDPNHAPSKILIQRFLSWSLSQIGVCGLWGVSVDNAVVVMKKDDSRGEAVYFDCVKDVLITQDGVTEIGPEFKIIRLDSTLLNRTKVMTREELISFLPMHTSYLAERSLSTPVRQMLSKIAMTFIGEVYPEENFLPRTRSASGF